MSGFRRIDVRGHCDGFRIVDGAAEELHGGACRSHEGLCACPCDDCAVARECKHESTFLSFGFMTSFARFETGHGRAKRQDGTDYVGPTVTLSPLSPDERRTTSWSSEMCCDCGMRLRGRRE